VRERDQFGNWLGSYYPAKHREAKGDSKREEIYTISSGGDGSFESSNKIQDERWIPSSL
jgi:hypothetical protein